jgi:hypothetical protein
VKKAGAVGCRLDSQYEMAEKTREKMTVSGVSHRVEAGEGLGTYIGRGFR